MVVEYKIMVVIINFFPILSFQLLARADKVSKLREEMQAQKANVSTHDDAVNKFVQYLNTQLKEIPKHVWHDFTSDAIKLVNTYVMKGKQIPSVSVCEVNVSQPQPSPASSLRAIVRPSPPRSYIPPSPFTSWMASPAFGLSSSLGSLISTTPGSMTQPTPTYATLNTPQFIPSPAPPTPCATQATILGRQPTPTTLAEGGSSLDVMDDFSYAPIE